MTSSLSALRAEGEEVVFFVLANQVFTDSPKIFLPENADFPEIL